MPVDFSALARESRILLEVPLKPVLGTRFQPTGFPDLGPALYSGPEESAMLLVESAQSMANRLEAVCWDDATDDIAPELKGLPFVRVRLASLNDGKDTTTSLQEFHRLNSPYITSATTPEKKPFVEVLRSEILPGAKVGEDGEGAESAGVVNLRRLAKVVFKYDPNSLVHGIFLEKIAGRLRHPRALSAFIEAKGVNRADSGGVKLDRALPAPKLAGLDAKGGYGNVPFSRSEFTAETITAFFALDLAQIRGYGLGDDASDLLIALSLWKVRRFLESGLRLRTACDLEPASQDGSLVARRPEAFRLPSTSDLAKAIRDRIARCKPLFAEPAVTELTWSGGEKKPKK